MKKFKWIHGKQYRLLNIELAWMWWGLLKGNECSEHTSLLLLVHSEQYGLLNIELAWTQWGLFKGNEGNEHTNLWKKLKWVHGEQYGLLDIESTWTWWAYKFMKKF